MSDDLSVVYIDDDIDCYLSRFLSNEFQTHYSEIVFDNGKEEGYQDLINELAKRNANIVIIDSRLFENNRVKYKFSGEQLKLAFQKIFPFMEIIVITQNDYADKYDDLHKFRPKTNGNDSVDYYTLNLGPVIKKAARLITVSRAVVDEIGKDSAIDSMLVEKLKNEINGIYEYKEMTKKDVDELIKSFRELKKGLDDADK